MHRNTEQQHFGNRLREVLRQRGYPADSPTMLMRGFNLHSSGPKITVHAARKWLIGETIPTQEKLLVLCGWLAVAPEWLRFDGDEPKDQTLTPSQSPRALAIAAKFDNLSEPNRQLVEEFIHLLSTLPERPRKQAQRNSGREA